MSLLCFFNCNAICRTSGHSSKCPLKSEWPIILLCPHPKELTTCAVKIPSLTGILGFVTCPSQGTVDFQGTKYNSREYKKYENLTISRERSPNYNIRHQFGFVVIVQEHLGYLRFGPDSNFSLQQTCTASLQAFCKFVTTSVQVRNKLAAS
ncbi:hypothetical protein AVEN_215847-1 [Araneus ventricosus]|uniref:Uncharacterized protein n=1 Tax=Araneus ventricosus TaxID=182803 RepID=A0A4Y2MRA9_ARAVE|nr:hypothetical protein AVEN_215847-1 [Araneus ventricosus]